MLPTLLAVHTRMELAHTALAQLLAHIQLAYQDPPGSPLQSCLPDSWTPACPSLLHEVFPSQMQGLALALVLLHELLVNVFLWPVQAPLPSTPAILQFCAIHRLAESAVCHPGCQWRCWTASWTLHHSSQLSESWQSSQFSIHLLIHLSQTVSYQFGGKETMGDCAKGFPKMKMHNINCLPHIHWCQWRHHREQWGWSSVICLCLLLRQEMDSEKIWSTTFAGMQLRLTSLQFPRSCFLLVLKRTVTAAAFKASQTFQKGQAAASLWHLPASWRSLGMPPTWAHGLASGLSDPLLLPLLWVLLHAYRLH